MVRKYIVQCYAVTIRMKLCALYILFLTLVFGLVWFPLLGKRMWWTMRVWDENLPSGVVFFTRRGPLESPPRTLRITIPTTKMASTANTKRLPTRKRHPIICDFMPSMIVRGYNKQQKERNRATNQRFHSIANALCLGPIKEQPSGAPFSICATSS